VRTPQKTRLGNPGPPSRALKLIEMGLGTPQRLPSNHMSWPVYFQNIQRVLNPNSIEAAEFLLTVRLCLRTPGVAGKHESSLFDPFRIFQQRPRAKSLRFHDPGSTRQLLRYSRLASPTLRPLQQLSCPGLSLLRLLLTRAGPLRYPLNPSLGMSRQAPQPPIIVLEPALSSRQ
jgi:hypothetical protein